MKDLPQLFKYTMYFDNVTNEIIFLEAWDENEIIYYDEFPKYHFIKRQLGYSLIDYLYLPFNEIQSTLNKIMENFNSYDFNIINEYLYNLTEIHPYFGFYLLKFHQIMDPDDFDEIDCDEILQNIKEDIRKSIIYCENEIIEILNECMNCSSSYEEIYFRHIEHNRINRFFRNGELLDYNLYYKTTFESISSYNSEPLDEYSFYKTCFLEYLTKHQTELDSEYEKIKTLSYDDYEQEYPYQTKDDENAVKNGIYPKQMYIQSHFSSYISENKEYLQEKYQQFLSKHTFQFVDSITVDEGTNVSLVNCLIFEMTTLLKKHCQINLCQNCGKMFPILGDYNAKYCERKTNNLTCKVIANRNATQAKIKDTPAIKLYMKYYKRYKGRVRIKKITEKDFESWNLQAKQKRDACIDGEMDINKFQQWLDDYEF